MKTNAAPASRRAPLTGNSQKPSVSSRPSSKPSTGAKESVKVVQTVADPEMEAKIQELTEQVTEMKLKVETAERERDFYFDKLRDIEIMCQAPELSDIPVC